MPLAKLRRELKRVSDPIRAEHAKRFFRTGAGEYGEGDVFIGAMVPMLRLIAKGYPDLPHGDLKKLLASRIHEERFIALVVLTGQFDRAGGSTAEQRRIVHFYLTQAKKNRINNWDLVDVSAPRILGMWLIRQQSPNLLDQLARSNNIWERRIAIVSTLALIVKAGQYKETFRLCERLMEDEHDLIHKACGWMLREAGKRDRHALLTFLDRHVTRMPRTMLRYAIERLPPRDRRHYLSA